MGKKNVLARKAYWATMSAETKSARMRDIAKKHYDNLSPEKRTEIGKRLLNARKKSQKFQFLSHIN